MKKKCVKKEIFNFKSSSQWACELVTMGLFVVTRFMSSQKKYSRHGTTISTIISREYMQMKYLVKHN